MSGSISSLSKAALGRRQGLSLYSQSLADRRWAEACEPVVVVHCRCSVVKSWTVRESDLGRPCWACGAALER